MKILLRVSFQLIITLIICFFNYETVAQNVSDKPLLLESTNLFEHEAKFRNWLNEQPKGTRGWKWQARYEYELLKRIDTDGKMPSAEAYLSSLQNINDLSKNRQAAEPEWSPAGPYGDKNLFGIGRVNCIAFHPKDSSTFYIGFGQGGIWKTTNGGKSYTPLGDKLPIMRVSCIAIDPSNPDILYISLCDFPYIGYDLYTADKKRNTQYGLGVYKSTDGGKTWNPTGLKNQLTELNNSLTNTIWINPSNTKELVVVGVKGIMKSKDGGDSWVLTLDKVTSQVVQDPSNPKILFAAAMFVATMGQGECGIWRSTDAGDSWSLLPTGIPTKTAQRVEIAVAPSNPKQIYGVTCGVDNGYEGFYRSADGGTTWEKSTNKSNILSDSYTSRGGQGFYDLCILVHPTDAKKVYVGGLILSESADGGTTWIRSTSYNNIHPDQHFLTYNSLNQTYYLCNDGGVYATKNIIANTGAITNWRFVCEGINATSCYRLSVSDDGKRVATGAQDNNTFYSKDGQNWSSELGGDGMECAITDKYFYASYQYGNIAFTTGNGSYDYVFPLNNSNDIGEWTTPFVVNKLASEIIIGSANIYKAPLGKNNQKTAIISFFPTPNIATLPQLTTALAVPTTNSKIIYAAKRANPSKNINAQLWKTTDNGTNWTDITNNIYKNSYITYMAVDDEYPDRAWLTLSNYVEGEKIYYSKDGGTTWTNISYNLPNLPANCIIHQGGKEADFLYVGLDIGVYYLLEGTTEWKPLMSNLPNVIIQELEINQATNKLYAATFGRGLWAIDLLSEDNFAKKDFYSMNVSLFPNANNGSFTLQTDYNQIDAIEIIDMLGRRVYEETLQAKALKFGKKITLQDTPSGVYFVRLISGNQAKVVRMVVGN